MHVHDRLGVRYGSKNLNSMARYILCLAALFAMPHTTAQMASEYELGSGDSIKIVVFGEPDLSMDLKITDSGEFTYPFLGELRVLGKTVDEVEQEIYDGLLGDYLVAPSVNVAVLEYRPFYINGEVQRPGSFPFSPGITVRKAIALAGGFTERASRRKIFVDRVDDGMEQLPIDLDERVRPGDTLTIEQGFF